MYVYILKSHSHSSKHYIGQTANLRQRLEAHNQGHGKLTSKCRPWTFKNFFWFADKSKARAFEKYLKSPSGRAFTKTHF